MTEQALKEYFENSLTAEQLSSDLKNSVEKISYDTKRFHIENIEGHDIFEVSTEHLLKLCNDAIDEFLSDTDVQIVAFALLGSEYFFWNDDTENGKVVASVLFDWDNPNIRFPLSKENFLQWKRCLHEEDYSLFQAY